MGLFYKAMIREIMESYVLSGEDDLEVYLKSNEDKFKKEYEMDGLLFYLNICELLRKQMVESDFFNKKFQEARAEDEKFSSFFNEE